MFSITTNSILSPTFHLALITMDLIHSSQVKVSLLTMVQLLMDLITALQVHMPTLMILVRNRVPFEISLPLESIFIFLKVETVSMNLRCYK